MYAVRRHRNLAPAVNPDKPKQPQRPKDETTRQHAIVAVQEVVCAANEHAPPCPLREPIVKRLEVGRDLMRFRIGRQACTRHADQKHERLGHPFADNVPEERASRSRAKLMSETQAVSSFGATRGSSWSGY